jgi:hypothetical protein
VAERGATIGMASDGSANAVVELSDLAPLEPGFTEVASASERSSKSSSG